MIGLSQIKKHIVPHIIKILEDDTELLLKFGDLFLRHIDLVNDSNEKTIIISMQLGGVEKKRLEVDR